MAQSRKKQESLNFEEQHNSELSTNSPKNMNFEDESNGVQGSDDTQNTDETNKRGEEGVKIDEKEASQSVIPKRRPRRKKVRVELIKDSGEDEQDSTKQEQEKEETQEQEPEQQSSRGSVPEQKDTLQKSPTPPRNEPTNDDDQDIPSADELIRNQGINKRNSRNKSTDRA